MSECTDTTAELVEEMRRIGCLGHWPTYDFKASLFAVAHRLSDLQAELNRAREKLRTLRPLRVVCKDKERLDWLQETLHVICYDGGEWFCASRGEDGLGWTDKPMADSPRAAIDAAKELKSQ